MIDLHLHSTASDGLLSPEALVQAAKREQLTAIALTDHDTLSGISRAASEAATCGVELLTGVEISIAFLAYRDVHLLGYGIDPDNRLLNETLEQFAEARKKRSDAIIDRINESLRSEGRIPLDPMEVQSQAQGVLGRPHIGRALIKRGYVTTMEEAFNSYLRPCNVAKQYWDWQEAISAIHAAGGVAVLAHPVTITRDCEELTELITRMAAGGLDGIEVMNNTALEHEVRHLQRCALALGLLMTAGSDFHGEPGPVRLGYGRNGFRFSDDLLPPLRERISQIRQHLSLYAP